MFNKKICKKCENKISDKYDFCPYCGSEVNENSKDEWGMLGENDTGNEFDNLFNSMPFRGISGKMINKMLGSAMKMLEKEMQKETRNQDTGVRTNFELFINGQRVDPRNIRVTKRPITQKAPVKKEAVLNNFSNENLKKFSSLPRHEPATNIRRLSNKVVYEIEMPEIKSIENVSIIKLENSIEVKAVSKNKSYFKLIPINLPITNYSLSKGKLVLELGVKD
ncbi:hypothetical protein COV12_02965 [Candidatus Woesearchaeota archaeon CG10_big_fil_rev_8_21_14_0_10_32_24]|nr:MAG: hypothetical protein COV12_02965 [Candidatus Woesearchaeota archaeon CG10_big_fil_rev_8_21_14_0_10_32_24]